MFIRQRYIDNLYCLEVISSFPVKQYNSHIIHPVFLSIWCFFAVGNFPLFRINVIPEAFLTQQETILFSEMGYSHTGTARFFSWQCLPAAVINQQTRVVGISNYFDNDFHTSPGHGIDGLVQERCNSIALAMELRLSCINPLIWGP